MNYSEYIAANLDKNIQYAEYVAESLNNLHYGEYVGYEDPAKKKREMREKKLNRIFKDFEPVIVETPFVETPFC